MPNVGMPIREHMAPARPARLLAVAAVAFCITAPLLAGPRSAADAAAAVGSISVVQPWAWATAPGASVGVVYFDIVNSGAADELVRIDSSAAQSVEMHSMTTAGGLMHMRPVTALAIAAGGRLRFRPGGLHVMLVGLKAPLQAGGHVPLTLTFLRSGRVSVEAGIRGLGTAAGASQNDDPGYRMAIWPPRAPSPDFHLLDGGGRARSLADYRGRIVIVFFGFVHCPDSCPAELLRLSLALKRLGPAHDKVRVLFVTLDPQRDTPAILRQYVAAFDPGFIALTGSAEQIDQAAAAFNVQYAKVALGENYTIDHSTSIYVFDARGTLRLVGSTDTRDRDLEHDLAALVAE
jgi:protein SCO1/2